VRYNFLIVGLAPFVFLAFLFRLLPTALPYSFCKFTFALEQTSDDLESH